MPDAIFDDRRLALVDDPLDPDRSDLDVYGRRRWRGVQVTSAPDRPERELVFLARRVQ